LLIGSPSSLSMISRLMFGFVFLIWRSWTFLVAIFKSLIIFMSFLFKIKLKYCSFRPLGHLLLFLNYWISLGNKLHNKLFH
jgi:hypothetical protein